ncbi:hypothetical protein ABZX40_23660 [Streptomyces sp. NPDC004610]|uniref:hypothetical protein n=1 Tax=unclassified Streptomyces TaxID=2593676 RepID=UPI0033AD0F91
METDSTVMYRHHIAPSRAYTQLSHDIIRHPRLSSDAVRLLTWQLSLPDGTREPLSRTAERAHIGACAFTRAKRQLKDEGFVHERRLQGPGGHWITQQLVSSVPLNDAEAARLLAQTPPPPPSPALPAVGQPTTPPTDRYPKTEPPENTPNQPPKPPAEPPAPPIEPSAEARALAAAYPRLSPALRHIPAAMHTELAQLTDRWLSAGHPPTAIRTHILRGLPDDGTPVHRPGGLLRHLLSHTPPPPEAETARAAQAAQAPPPPPPTPALRLSPRLTRTRECAGHHLQPTLFRPLADETLCPRCLPLPPPLRR